MILRLALLVVRSAVRALRRIDDALSARLRARADRGRRTFAELTPGDCVDHGCAFFYGGCLRCGRGSWDPSRLTMRQVPPFLRTQITDKIRVRTVLLVDVDEER